LSTPVLTNSRLRPAPWELLLVAALLCLHAWLGLSATLDKSCTFDELAHITAGHAYWAQSAWQLQPENGNLPQRIAGLPAYLLNEAPPPSSDPAWRGSDVWSLGLDYLYHSEVTPEMRLLGARSAAMVWSLGCGLLVFLWSRSLFGQAGGLFSLGLFVFAPEFLAHGFLANSDACACLFLLLSTWSFWRCLESPSAGRVALSSLCLGLAFLAKLSALLLIPSFGLMLLTAWLVPGGEAPAVTSSPLRRLLLLASAHAAGVWLLIWAAHGFMARPPAPFEHYLMDWPQFTALIGWKAELVHRLSTWRILPEPYVYGLDFVLSRASERGAFLMGATSSTGWWYFFPLCFLFKSTLALLTALASLLLWKAGTLLRRLRDWRATLAGDPVFRGLLPLAAFSLVYVASSLVSHLNIGHRHILPLYPVCYIVLGALGAALLRGGTRAGLVAAMLILAGQAGESFLSRPHYLASFNLLAGGPDEGHALLVDSSLDWGQDLPGLADWLDHDPEARAGARIHAALFTVADPARHLPRARMLLTMPVNHGLNDRAAAEPGLYCVSATLLEQAYLQPRQWTPALEAQYQEYRAHAAPLLTPAPRGPLARPVSAKAERFWHDYETLRFMRLAGWLRARQPDAVIGRSLLVYRLGRPEIHQALEGSWSEWAATAAREPAP
jgi:hypothetical protein